MHVLTVDDSRASRLVIRKYMTDLGFQMTEANDGSEGLMHIKKGAKFDLFVVSSEMPGMKGTDFIRKVREDAAHGTKPIIMASNTDSFELMVAAIEAGASEYLVKPFSKEAFTAKLDILGIEYT